MVDTRAWNLSWGAVATTALAACGPSGVDGTTDTDTATGGPTQGDPTSTVECNSATDCPSGHQCIDHVCRYDCASGACCDGDCCYGDCYYGDSTDTDSPPFYECGYDAECELHSLCNAERTCEPIQLLPECPPEVGLLLLELIPDQGDPFLQLALVDTNGDAAQDLLVGHTTTGAVELYLGPVDAPPVALPVLPNTGMRDAVSGDLDGDGDADLVLLTEQGLMTLVNDGAGGFVPGVEQPLEPPQSRLIALDWNGDGVLDVAGVPWQGPPVVVLGDGAGSFTGSVPLTAPTPVRSAVEGRFTPEGFDELVVQEDQVGSIFSGSPSGDPVLDATLPGNVHGYRIVLSGDIDGPGPDEVVGASSMQEGMLLEVWPDAVAGPYYSLYVFDGGISHQHMGDVDGDGSSDVVLGSDDDVAVVLSDPSASAWLSCETTRALSAPVHQIEVGDIDGDGRAEVVVHSLGTVLVLSLP